MLTIVPCERRELGSMDDEPKCAMPILTGPLAAYAEQQRILDEIRDRLILSLAIPARIVEGETNYASCRSLIVYRPKK